MNNQSETNTTIQSIENRVSLRRFSEKPISKETKELLFHLAMRAPTAGNQMLYSMLDITDMSIKEQLAVLCDNQPFIARAPMVVVFLADQQRWFDYYDLKGVKVFCESREELDYESPQESDLFLACEDTLCAAQTMVIAAESMGIGSCYIGDILENNESVSNLLNLPPLVFPIAMLVLGYYPDDFKRKTQPRFDSEYIVFENTYQRLDDKKLNQMFNQAESEFNPKNKVGASNFAQQFYARKTGAAFSKEMARSVKAMLENWRGGKR